MAMAWGDISALLQPMFDTAKGYGGALVPLGKTLLSLAFVLTVGNELLAFWVGGGAQKFLAKMLRLAIVTSIPLAAMASWSNGPMNGAFVNFFTSEIPATLKGSAVGGSAFDTVSNTITSMFAALPSIGGNNAQTTASSGATGSTAPAQCLDVNGGLHPMPPGGVCPGGTTSTDTNGTSSEGHSMWYAISHLGETMATLIVWIFLGVPVLILGVAMLFALYGPLLMLQIGIVFGPVLIAWLPFEPLANLATNWLRFMITMGVSFAVGILMALIGTATLQNFTTVFGTMSGLSLSTFGAFIGGILASMAAILFLAYMMFKVEHIGSALVGGPSVGGGAGFLGMAAGMAMRGAGKAKSGKDNKTSGTGGEGGQSAAAGQSGGSTAGGAQSGSGASGGTAGGASTPQAGGTQAALSSQAAATSQGATSSQSAGGSAASQSLGQRMKDGAARAMRSDTAKLAAFSGAVAAGPVAAAVVGGGILASKGVSSLRSGKGTSPSSAPVHSAPSQALAKTQPLRKVKVPEKRKT